MSDWMHAHPIDALLAGFGVVFVCASLGRRLYERTGRPSGGFAQRLENWWALWFLLVFVSVTGTPGSIFAFGLMSLLALREFITLAPTARGDHRALFWSFFVVTPVQYALIVMDQYALFSILIPVYGGMVIAGRAMLAGQTEDFLQRIATIQWALLTCIYCLSYAPALYLVEFNGETPGDFGALVFVLIIVSLTDLVQAVVTPYLPRHRLAPRVSAHKTWEGLIVATLAMTALSAGALAWMLDLSAIEAGLVGLVVSSGSVISEMVLSAVKRDRGIRNYRRMDEADNEIVVEVHGEVLDRISGLVFAAPVAYHLLAMLHAM